MPISLNERALSYFAAVVDHGGIRAGADHLRIDPATLSRAVAKLEQDIGAALLERNGRGACPTEAGRVLLEHYRWMSAHKADTLTRLEELRGSRRGQIDIALGEGFIEDLLDGALSAFCRVCPGIVVNQFVGGGNDILHKVAEGEVHVGLIYSPPPDSRIESRGAWRQPLCVMTLPDHPLVSRGGPVSLAEIAIYPLALLHGAFGVRQLVDMATAAAKIRLIPRLTSNSFSALREFVFAGLGLAFMPAFAARRFIAAGSLCAIEVADILCAKAEAHIIVRRGRRLPASAMALTECMAKTMHAFGGGRENPAAVLPRTCYEPDQ